MKHFRIIILPLLIFSLAACGSAIQDEQSVDDSSLEVSNTVDSETSRGVTEEISSKPTTLTFDAKDSVYDDPDAFADYIETSSNYRILEDNSRSFFTSRQELCPDLDPFFDKLIAGEVAYLDLGEGVVAETLFATPNYEAWSQEEAKANINRCADGVGYLFPLKTYPDHILWGSLGCGGARVEKGDMGYEKQQECLRINKLLDAYLGGGGPSEAESKDSSEVSYDTYDGYYVGFQYPLGWNIFNSGESVYKNMDDPSRSTPTLSVGVSPVMYGDIAWTQLDFYFYQDDVSDYYLNLPLGENERLYRMRVDGYVANVFDTVLPKGVQQNKGNLAGTTYVFSFPDRSIKSLVIWKQARGDAAFENGVKKILETMEFKNI